MSTITTRIGKGSALTWEEADANFTNLNTDKVETDDLAAASGASLVGYLAVGTGAVATDVQSKLHELVSVEDYSTHAQYVTASSNGGFFRDDTTPGIESRVRDRLFIGDSARYTGNRLGANGYGSSWITEHAASWIIKNSVMSVSNEGNAGIALLGSSRTLPGETSSPTNCGVAGLTLNEGTGTFARAIYTETIHKSVGGGSAGIEIQVGNFTTDVPVISAYGMDQARLSGIYLGVESGVNYTTGDADIVSGPGLNPAGAAMDISGGSLGASYQKWTGGIVFRDGALVRDVNGYAEAALMARKHKLSWEIGTGLGIGANITSEVTINTQRTGIRFENRRVRLLGDGGRILVDTVDETAGAGAVNYPILKNSRTAVAIALGAEGTDTNISTDIYSKGTGVVRLASHGGAGENLRIIPPASAPTDYLTIAGTSGGAIAAIGAAGASTNIDIRLAPKGTGVLRFGAFTASGDAAVNGYVTIKTDDGTIRKLATIA